MKNALVRENKKRASFSEVRHALMKSVYNDENNNENITYLRNTIDGIFIRSEDASSLLSYVF